MKFALVLLIARQTLPAQLEGVVDIHVHSDPDSLPRSIDALDAARLAKSRGIRALLLKNHYESTASLAYAVRKAVPGIDIFGGIALNRSVGGVNPAAVERMALLKGGLGRVVWMPTFDAEQEIRVAKANRPYVSVSRAGVLLPEAIEVLDVIAKYKLALATGHSSPAEALMLIREARRKGIERIVVTHAMHAPVRMSLADMQQAVKAGAMIEFPYYPLIAPERSLKIDDYVKAIRAIGAGHCILSSDLGQATTPLHPDGFAAFLKDLTAAGLSPAELRAMSAENPARFLGLAR